MGDVVVVSRARCCSCVAISFGQGGPAAGERPEGVLGGCGRRVKAAWSESGAAGEEPVIGEGVEGFKRWTPSTGQLIDVAKWNLLRYIPVKMRGAEDDKEETAKPFASL